MMNVQYAIPRVKGFPNLRYRLPSNWSPLEQRNDDNSFFPVTSFTNLQQEQRK